MFDGYLVLVDRPRQKNSRQYTSFLKDRSFSTINMIWISKNLATKVSKEVLSNNFLDHNAVSLSSSSFRWTLNEILQKEVIIKCFKQKLKVFLKIIRQKYRFKNGF